MSLYNRLSESEESLAESRETESKIDGYTAHTKTFKATHEVEVEATRSGKVSWVHINGGGHRVTLAEDAWQEKSRKRIDKLIAALQHAKKYLK